MPDAQVLATSGDEIHSGSVLGIENRAGAEFYPRRPCPIHLSRYSRSAYGVRPAIWQAGQPYGDLGRDFLPADLRNGSRRFAKVLAGHQLKDQLIERDLGLVICAREAYQLTIQIHGVVAGFAIVDDLFAVHARNLFPGVLRLRYVFVSSHQ
jgi:hypothetical protein